MSDGPSITITIKGHDFTVAPPFTNRELHTIKQVSGVRAGELWDAMAAGDNDVTVALALIGAKRAGAARPTLDDLWDLPAGEMKVTVSGADEDSEDPTDAAAAASDSGDPATTPSDAGTGPTDTTSA